MDNSILDELNKAQKALQDMNDKLATLHKTEKDSITGLTTQQILANTKIAKEHERQAEENYAAALERIERVKVAEEKAATEVAKLRRQNEETRTAIESEKALRQEKLVEKRIGNLLNDELNQIREVDNALMKFSLNASSSSGKLLAKAIQNDQAYQKQHQHVADLMATFPKIIGSTINPIKQVGTMLDMLSSYTDKFGNAHSLTNTGTFGDTGDLAKSMGTSRSTVNALSKNARSLIKSDSAGYQRLKAAEESGDGRKINAALNALKKEMIANAGSDEQKNAIKNMSREQVAALTKISENQTAAADARKVFFANTTAMLSDLSKELSTLTDEIASQQSAIDTRLYGSQKNGQSSGSYWKQINKDFSSLMISPLVDQKTVMSNLLKAVDKGISRDVEQMALLDTMKDKIATTFNVYDSTVLRLIKIQDTNTTAVRLGMEATLNEMLNSMYESTEYLSDISSSVRSQLTEAEALMDAGSAVEFEFQVQKWLGSMYSVGVSNSTVEGLATALGQLASGNIEGITSGGLSNALIMAANNGNMSLSDILANGLDASEVNVLLNNTVSYMAELVNESGGSNVVLQQLAKTFGMTASDLKAITNIISDDHYVNQSAILSYGSTDTLGTLYNKLYSMADTMYDRTSLGEMMSNVWNNVKYSTAAGIASNSALYLTTKLADVMDAVAGGVEFSLPLVMGTGSAQTFKTSDILRSASLLGGFGSSLVSMLANLGSGNGVTGSGLLNLVGVNNKVTRGVSTSSSGSGTIINASVSDMSGSAKNSATGESEATTVQAQEESTEVTNKTLNESILSIYTMLQEVVDGTSTLSVKIAEQPLSVSDTALLGAWTK